MLCLVLCEILLELFFGILFGGDLFLFDLKFWERGFKEGVEEGFVGRFCRCCRFMFFIMELLDKMWRSKFWDLEFFFVIDIDLEYN